MNIKTKLEEGKIKLESRAANLSRRFGGKWKYKGFSGRWDCDDGIRYVCYVLTGRDIDGEYTGESSLCMYFLDGRSPKWI